MTQKKDYKTLVLPPKYVPKKTEPYMSVEQKAFFYQMLMAEKANIEEEMGDTDGSRIGQRMDSLGALDEGDAATLSVDADLKIKMQERNEKLLNHIIAALHRLEDGTFGYSVVSGEEIGLKRLMIRPVATMTLEEKEATEK